MSAKVVPLRPPKNMGNLQDIDADYTMAVRAFVNSKVRLYVQGRGHMARLALRAGVATQTVSRLAYYETTRPTWHTIMSVIMALEAMQEFAELTQRWADKHG